MLPGLVIQSEPKRLYPAGKAVAHLVGYVSEVTEADLTANRFPGAGLGSIVGEAGLEREYDDTLRGARGRALHRGERARPPGARGGERRVAAADARQADQHHHRPRPAALHRQHLAGRGARRHDRDDADGRGPRALLRADLRPERVRRRHLHRALAEPQRRRGPPAAQPRDPDALSAGLAVQAGDRGDGAEARADRARHPHAHALPRRAPAGQPGVPLLEEGGPRLARPASARWRRAATSTSTSWACGSGSTRSSRTAC